MTGRGNKLKVNAVSVQHAETLHIFCIKMLWVLKITAKQHKLNTDVLKTFEGALVAWTPEQNKHE